MKRTKKEKLALGVLQSVFGANTETVNNFNHEFDHGFESVKKKVVNDIDENDTIVKYGVVKPLNKTAGEYDWIEPYVEPNSKDRGTKLAHNLMHVVHAYV